MKQIKVLIADPQAMSRQLLELCIHTMAGYHLAASAADASALLKLCADHRPDLVLMDPVSPCALTVAGRLRADYPRLKLIFLSSAPEHSLPDRARQLGADSFCYRDALTTPLPELLERTMSGQSVYPASAPEVPIGLARSSDFTRREKDVLYELLEGHSNRIIADRLGISEHAVHYHINNMLSKTGYTNRVKLAVMVRKSGFVINAEENRVMK